MQKKILVLAMAAAISSPAFADTANVSMYGKVDMAIGSTSNGTSAAGVAGTSATQVSSQVTKLGFKGAEDLGDGLSAIWQIEQQIDIDSSGTGNSTHTTFATRNSFAGLKGDSWGTVLLGQNDTPYKAATRGLDVFGDQLPDNRSLMGGGTAANGGGAHDLRPGNVIAYMSPDMNGFSASVAYVAGAESATVSTDVKGSAWSLAGMYKAGPLYAALAYEVIDGTTAVGAVTPFSTIGGNKKAKATKLGVGYTMDALQLNAVYEKTSDNLGAGGVDAFGRADYYLAGVYSFGSDDVKLAYTHAGTYGATPANTGAKQFSVGYDHNLSKRTSLYAQYTKLSNDTAAAYKLTTSGSTAGGMALTGAGADPSAWAVGMKHTF